MGVVFGVGAVTAVSAVGEGARREALDQIGDLGIDTITVRAKAPAAGGPPPALRVQDAAAVRAVGADVVAVAPVRESTASVQGAGRSTDAGVVGTTADYASAARLRISSGRFLAGLDVERAQAGGRPRRVRRLRPLPALRPPRPAGPGGRRLVRRGRGGGRAQRAARPRRPHPEPRREPRGLRPPDVPRPRRRSRAPTASTRSCCAWTMPATSSRSAEVVKAVVRRTSGSDAFDVIVPREILRQKERTQRIFNVVTGAIAAISLLVGGIGIMNIMLASVAERTREVGIRRAVGASRRDIAAQFLVESSLLTATGGVLGTLLGIAGSFADPAPRRAGPPRCRSRCF